MRKIVSILCIFCASVTLMAQTDSVQYKGIHPFKVEENEHISTEHAYWSLIPYVGMGLLQADFSGGEARSTFALPVLGIGAECSFNPVWGIGAEYDFARYSVRGKKNGANADTVLLGYTHNLGAYVTADLMNLFDPYGRKKYFSLNVQVGGGGALHRNKVYYAWSAENPGSRGHTASYTPREQKSYEFDPFLKFGANFEFNINRLLAVGLRVAYTMYLTDVLDGRMIGPNTDGLTEAALNLRIKFESTKKTHARNVEGRDFPDQRAITVTEAKDFARGEDNVFGPATNAYAAAPARDTVVIYRDTVIIRETGAAPAAVSRAAQRFYIYFDTEKAHLNEEGLITIQQVADVMEADQELYALVVGYCDNTGTRASNYELGDLRSSNVAEELMAEYNIAPERLYAVGYGIVIGGRSTAAYGPNRRVVVELVDKETFERRRAELENAKNNRVYDEASQVQKATKEDILKDFAKREGQTIKSEPSTTLAQLARKYYNNTHCWVYIYAANKSKLSSPNTVTPGTNLLIPQISEQEQKINKDECLRIYKQIR
jgi:outer membrane protein OmpA-like peptidoglycan-associated protein